MRKFFLALLLFALPANAGFFSFDVKSQKSVTVTTVSALVEPADEYRNYLMIQNQGTGDISITFGHAQTGTEGFILEPGASYEPLRTQRNSVFIKGVLAPQLVVVLTGV